MLSRQLIGCTAATMAGYRELLGRFTHTVSDAWTEALAVRRYLADLHPHMKPISVHRHYRALRTFCGWAVEAGLLLANPLAGDAMRRASTLPRVPEDEAIRRLLGACDAETYEGRRNRALIALLAVRAELPRKVGPHALRHYAATSILRQTGDLELVRQVLRHESLAMALRYAHLTKPDVSAKFRRASPLDNLRAGR